MHLSSIGMHTAVIFLVAYSRGYCFLIVASILVLGGFNTAGRYCDSINSIIALNFFLCWLYALHSDTGAKRRFSTTERGVTFSLPVFSKEQQALAPLGVACYVASSSPHLLGTSATEFSDVEGLAMEAENERYTWHQTGEC